MYKNKNKGKSKQVKPVPKKENYAQNLNYNVQKEIKPDKIKSTELEPADIETTEIEPIELEPTESEPEKKEADPTNDLLAIFNNAFSAKTVFDI